MKETEYIRVQSLANIRAAETLLRQVLTGEEYGVSTVRLAEVMRQLSKMRGKLEREIEIISEET